MALAWKDLKVGAEAQARPVFSAPIPGVNIDYVLKQRFQQQLDDYLPVALNTAHPQFPTYYLVEESEKEYLSGGEVSWTRTYSQVPAQHIEPSSFQYAFIGFIGRVQYVNGVQEPGSISYRNRFAKTVFTKVQLDYFLTDGTSAGISAIPIIQHTRFLLVPSSMQIDADYLAPVGAIINQTVPTVEDYIGWIDADIANPDSFHLVVEDSSISRWMGNIIVRATKFIKAA